MQKYLLTSNYRHIGNYFSEFIPFGAKFDCEMTEVVFPGPVPAIGNPAAVSEFRNNI